MDVCDLQLALAFRIRVTLLACCLLLWVKSGLFCLLAWKSFWSFGMVWGMCNKVLKVVSNFIILLTYVG